MAQAGGGVDIFSECRRMNVNNITYATHCVHHYF